MSTAPFSPQNDVDHAERSTTMFLPDLWREHDFLSYAHNSETNDTLAQQQHEALKEEVRKILMAAKDEAPALKLRLIDTFHRLGISYHFKSELANELQKIYRDCNVDNCDLYTTSLWFRLLRQEGIKVPCDVFKRFKDNNDGNFKASLTSDAEGMQSLYEAAFLSLHGEDILDEAIAFTSKNLQTVAEHASPGFADQIRRSLDRPMHKCVQRVTTRYNISIYEKDDQFHNKTLLKFAKLDFNILQVMHQKELAAMKEWWEKIDVTNKLPYVRDRIVELFFWVIGVYYEPEHALSRKILLKVSAIATIFDDTYDNFGTYHELVLFTDAIRRWDLKAMDVLTDYMKHIYCLVIDTWNEFEEEITAIHGRETTKLRVDHTKAATKRLLQNYLCEAKWRTEEYTPTMEEYLAVARVTSCYPQLALHSYLALGPEATKEAFDWVSIDPIAVMASATIGRLMDDIVGHTFEQKTRNHVASAVEILMKHHGMAEEEAKKKLRNEIANAWKDINETYLNPPPDIPLPLVERVLNLARVIDIFYKDDDIFNNNHLIKDLLALLFKDSIPIGI